MIASSPIDRARRPASTYARAASSLADRTAGDQPYRRASASQRWIAAGQASGSPSGSPLARLTPFTTRYAIAASFPGANTTALSRRVAKYPSESRSPCSRSSRRTSSSSGWVRYRTRCTERRKIQNASTSEAAEIAPTVRPIQPWPS
jgi:hypothetical protein